MTSMRSERAARAFSEFIGTPLSVVMDRARRDPGERQVARFHRVAEQVPAYRAFLGEHGVEVDRIRGLADLARVPIVSRANYLDRYPLAERCREGDLALCDTVALSSGSTGEPTWWPRSLSDEYEVATRFEQVFHDAFEADRKRTLAVVCFPLGTWVGGMFTASCCRHLAAKGYPLLVVTPGNHKAEILRAVRSLAPSFEQTVLLGYPPFLKDVIDSGIAEHLAWSRYSIKLVLAGEVISEEWRTLMARRAGLSRIAHDCASLYGTADAGVLGNETPLSVTIRRFLAERPDATRALFGDARLPTLVQYDPQVRYFEEVEGLLVFSGDNGVPLMRYQIGDRGGVVPYGAMLDRIASLGFDVRAAMPHAGERGHRELPFVYVFGRSRFAVSFYGANVFPETVSIALEQPGLCESLTGKFVLEVRETAEHDSVLQVAVELAVGMEGRAGEELAGEVAEAIVAVLMRLNSEFASYVPEERRRPKVRLLPAGDAEYFPPGVKHRYSRKAT